MCTVPTGQPPFVGWWLSESDCYWIATDFGAFIPFLSFSILFYPFHIWVCYRDSKWEGTDLATKIWRRCCTHQDLSVENWLVSSFSFTGQLINRGISPKKHKTTTSSWIFAKGHPNWFSEDKKVSHEQGIPLWPTQMTEGNHWLLSSALGNSPPMAMDLMFPHYNHYNHRLHGISPYFLHVWLRRVAREWVLHTTKSCFFSLWQNCGFERMREFEEATEGLKWDLERHELKMFWQEKWRLHNSQ